MRKTLFKLLTLSSIYSVGTFAENAVLFLFLPVLTSFLSPAEFGLVAMGSLASDLCVALTTPFMSALNRFYYSPDFSKKRSVLLWNLFFLMTLKALIIAFAFFLLSSPIAYLIGGDKQITIVLVRFFSISIFFQCLVNYLRTFIRLEQRAVYFASVSITQIIISCIVLVLLLNYSNLAVMAVPIAISVRAVIGIVGYLPVFSRFVSCKWNLDVVKKPLKYGYPMILFSYSHNLLQTGDRAVLRIFCPMSLVGVYDLGYRIASGVNILLALPVKDALQPIAFKQEGHQEEQKHFIRRSATVYYGVALFLGLLVSIFSKEVVMVMARQESYHIAWIVVPFIVFGYIQYGLNNFLGIGLEMKKKAFLLSWILMFAAGINISLNFLLVPVIGIIGAAIATIIGYLVWNVLSAYFSWKHYGQYFEYLRFYYFSFLWIAFVLLGVCVPVSGWIFLLYL